jgi:hypothetical protein
MATAPRSAAYFPMAKFVSRTPFLSPYENFLYCAFHCAARFFVGRGERIRTSDPCVPNAVLYQAEPHPDLNRHDSALYISVGIYARS